MRNPQKKRSFLPAFSASRKKSMYRKETMPRAWSSRKFIHEFSTRTSRSKEIVWFILEHCVTPKDSLAALHKLHLLWEKSVNHTIQQDSDIAISTPVCADHSSILRWIPWLRGISGNSWGGAPAKAEHHLTQWSPISLTLNDSSEWTNYKGYIGFQPLWFSLCY